MIYTNFINLVIGISLRLNKHMANKKYSYLHFFKNQGKWYFLFGMIAWIIDCIKYKYIDLEAFILGFLGILLVTLLAWNRTNQK